MQSQCNHNKNTMKLIWESDQVLKKNIMIIGFENEVVGIAYPYKGNGLWAMDP